MEQTITYKGFSIKIALDEFPENPFTAWDEPSLIYLSSDVTTDYSNGEIDRYLSNFLTPGQICYHQAELLDLVSVSKTDFDLDFPLGEYTKAERIDMLDNYVSEYIGDCMRNKEEFCDLFGITYLCKQSTGYGQSDWANVFIIFTDEDSKKFGTPKEHEASVLQGVFNLFTAWAWGDVYGYNITDGEGNEIEDGSCWGFYGDDMETNGLLDSARNIIDCEIAYNLKCRNNKLKALLQNHVPLNIRARLLAA